MPPHATGIVSPEQIVSFVLEEMEAAICPTYYTFLVPSVYDIYLFADDYERLRPLESRMREEAAMALAEKLSTLNRSAEPKRKLSLGTKNKRVKRYETLGDWSIEFHENAEDD